MIRKEKIERMFISNSGYYGINFDQISRAEKFPDGDFSIFLYTKDNEDPIFRIKHRSKVAMDANYENILAIMRGCENKVIDFSRYKEGV